MVQGSNTNVFQSFQLYKKWLIVVGLCKEDFAKYKLWGSL